MMSETQSENAGITPRVLLRIDLEETPTRDPQTRYEAQTVNSSIRGGNNYEKVIVGFAEFPVGARLSSCEEFDEFREMVESKAGYVHWKPDETA